MKNLDTVYAQRIASEYDQKPTSKLIALKKLDRKAKLPAAVLAYVLGGLGTLALGVGMCLCMGQIGQSLPFAMPLGVGLGLGGLAVAGVNYPIYKRLLERGKQKYAFEIMELAREITVEGE